MRFCDIGLKKRIRSSAAALLLVCCCAACSNSNEELAIFNPQDLPDNTLKGASILRSAEGRLQMTMTAPVIQQYSKPEPKTIYPKGLSMRFFNGPKNPTATLRAGYAEEYSRRNLMRVRDSVVIIDLRSHDTIYLQNLTWDALSHRIYSDKPLRSVNGPRVTIGDSFESDDSLKSPIIINQRGTIEWKGE